MNKKIFLNTLVDEETMKLVKDFQFDNRLDSRADAIRMLLDAGLKYWGDHESGYKEGYDQGQDEARGECHQEAIEKGYEKGKEEGYEKGLEDGYEKGREGGE